MNINNEAIDNLQTIVTPEGDTNVCVTDLLDSDL